MGVTVTILGSANNVKDTMTMKEACELSVKIVSKWEQLNYKNIFIYNINFPHPTKK